jgi:hypothetical protein
MEQMEHRGDAPFSGPISPELVLVSSPEDARRARELLPEPGAAIARLERTDPPLDPERPLDTERPLRTERPLEVLDPRSLFAAAEATAGGSSRRPVVRFSRSLVWAVPTAGIVALAVIVALPVAGLTPKVRPFLVESAAPAATLEDPDVAPVAPRTPLLLSWPAQPGIRRYRVQLALAGPRAETVVLGVRTNEPHLAVRRRLGPGIYRWYVWPDDGGAAGRYDVSVASGAFEVP